MAPDQNVTPVENVPAEEWATWIEENDAALLDVREPFEWEQGTLPGATLIAMGEIPQRMTELDPSRAHLVVCLSGARSLQVAMYLAGNGFTNVANMSGGMKALAEP